MLPRHFANLASPVLGHDGSRGIVHRRHEVNRLHALLGSGIRQSGRIHALLVPRAGKQFISQACGLGLEITVSERVDRDSMSLQPESQHRNRHRVMAAGTQQDALFPDRLPIATEPLRPGCALLLSPAVRGRFQQFRSLRSYNLAHQAGEHLGLSLQNGVVKLKVDHFRLII